ncbi:Phospholipase/carboxylesterase/thioesterase [Syncephalis pseudoplumigaleata]|uniref:Acyl-protein thioesterase 1 n=1 Tax=Syncephalis pseudoplumigaleata TaxID=1712513 RepID=A0A4P9Z4U0_9FUNG|nr:Phospholipase/carboxylesterase/thioesterase [Syncephalis pseudoplumigaleata]|eukprot:RKP27603.1 Phospholipase/carboxylesterase/thioesterase [Syncephalis pseudoplumigaleata]
MTSSGKPLTAIEQKPTQKHTATVFFMHGLGDSGAGWAPVTENLAQYMPHVKFVLPNAPARPVTLNFGMSMPAWYDIHSLADMDQEEDDKGVLESLEKITKMIRDEMHHGIPSNRIVVGGFSQGSALALLTGMTFDYKLAGIIGLSGYLPLRTKISTMMSEANRKTRIFMGHGDSDEVVQYKFATLSAQTLEKAGYPVTFKAYRGMGHSSSPDELRDMLTFLNEIIPNEPTATATASSTSS